MLTESDITVTQERVILVVHPWTV